MMRKVIVFIVLTLVLLSGNAYAGPFGLEMGMTLKQIRKIDPKAKRIAPGKFVLTTVPKPHSAFIEYIVQICPKSGLSWIKAIGDVVSTNSFGTGLKGAFDDLFKRLENIYGKGQKVDWIPESSIWREPNEWMIALKKEERYLMARWKKDKGAKMKDGLVGVYLTAKALSMYKGYIVLEYRFENDEACDKEIKAKEDAAL